MADQGRMKVVPVPVLSDNYAYLVYDDRTLEAAAVDPADYEKVIAAAKQNGVTITTILTTHHHMDHAGGNEDMCTAIPNLRVIGADDRIPALNEKVSEGSVINVGDLSITCRFTPCHTTGHILYVVKSPSPSQPLALFSGDTLFVGGCGRFFEGTADQMNKALNEVVANLPGDTQVWCGHEYTVANLKFALSVEPENQVLKEKYEWAVNQRSQGLQTIPSTVAGELQFNPFMRVSQATIKNAVGGAQDSDNETMMKLREAKNSFK